MIFQARRTRPEHIGGSGLSDNVRWNNARQTGLSSLQRITASEIADAGRTADGVAIAARPEVEGYTRVLELPSCARCAILAGKFFRWNQGFLRHPRCDCRHLPQRSAETAVDALTDPREAIRSGQVHGLSEADTQAVLDGADPAQVVNARRGMYVAADGRKMTTEGTTKRGWAGGYVMNGEETKRSRKAGSKRSYRRVQRTRPEEIYRIARDRDEAIEMLRQQGYFVDDEQSRRLMN